MLRSIHKRSTWLLLCSKQVWWRMRLISHQTAEGRFTILTSLQLYIIMPFSLPGALRRRNGGGAEDYFCSFLSLLGQGFLPPGFGGH